MTTIEKTDINEEEFGLSFKEFCALSQKELIVSNWMEVLADLETPVSIYSKLREASKDAFLFESVEGGEKIGRYSIIGYKPLKSFASYDEDPYQKLELELKKYQDLNNHDQLPFFHKGYVSYLAFETVKYAEPRLQGQLQKHRLPEMYALLVGSLAVFDHAKHKLYLISNIFIDKKDEDPNAKLDEGYLRGLYEKSIQEIKQLKEQISISHQLENIPMETISLSPQKIDFESNTGKEEYMKMVNKAKDYILEGDIFQVVPSHRMTAKVKVDPLHAFRILRTINPSPYLFLFNINSQDRDQKPISFSLVGSSPEMVVKNTKDPSSSEFIAELRPIAGTYPRGKNPQEDDEFAAKLLKDQKEIAEHVMLVDLGRNDLGRVCKNNSIEVAENMVIEKYSHVLHIVSSVIGKLKDEHSGIGLLKACFPAGTLSGAPKIRAMEIIAELEKDPRGPYGGCIGYFSLDKSIDTAMIIRTMLIEDDQVTIQAGGGVVADSDPEKEYQETLNKAGALMKVVSLTAE